MGTKTDPNSAAPTSDALRDDEEEKEDDRLAAEEAAEEDEEDAAVVTDAREGRIPGPPLPTG